MAKGLNQRIRALERQASGNRRLDLKHLTDRELTERILRFELEREPTASEIDAELAFSANDPVEAQRLTKEKAAWVRREIAGVQQTTPYPMRGKL